MQEVQLCDNQELLVVYFSDYLFLEKQIFCKLYSMDFCIFNCRD